MTWSKNLGMKDKLHLFGLHVLTLGSVGRAGHFNMGPKTVGAHSPLALHSPVRVSWLRMRGGIVKWLNSGKRLQLQLPAPPPGMAASISVHFSLRDYKCFDLLSCLSPTNTHKNRNTSAHTHTHTSGSPVGDGGGGERDRGEGEAPVAGQGASVGEMGDCSATNLVGLSRLHLE